MEVIKMGRYFVYKDLTYDEIKIYHAKDDADIERVFGILDNMPDKFKTIKTFFDEFDATVRLCRSDFAYDVVDALSQIMGIFEIPVLFRLDFGRSNASGGWLVHVVSSISPYVQSITYTDQFYDFITSLLRDFDQEVSFVGAEKNRFICSEVVG
jgi:hypothetical protein